MQWAEGRLKVLGPVRPLSSAKPSRPRFLKPVSSELRISRPTVEFGGTGEDEVGGAREADVFLGAGEEGEEDWEDEEARGDDEVPPLWAHVDGQEAGRDVAEEARPTADGGGWGVCWMRGSSE